MITRQPGLRSWVEGASGANVAATDEYGIYAGNGGNGGTGGAAIGTGNGGTGGTVGGDAYAHDVETTVGLASPAIRTGYVAAFSVPAEALGSPNGNGGEQFVIVAEGPGAWGVSTLAG